MLLVRFILQVIVLLACAGFGMWLVNWMSSDKTNARHWGQKNLNEKTIESICDLTVKIFEAELGKKIYNWFSKQKVENLYIYDSRDLLKQAKMGLSLYSKKPDWTEYWQKREGATDLDEKNPEVGLLTSLNRSVPYWAVEKVSEQYIWKPLVEYVAKNSELKNQFIAEYDALDILRMRFDAKNKGISWKFVETNHNKLTYDITLTTRATDRNQVYKVLDWSVVRVNFTLDSQMKSMFRTEKTVATSIMSCNVFSNQEAIENGILMPPAQLYKMCVIYTKDMLKTVSTVKETRLKLGDDSKLDSINKKIQSDFMREAQKSHLDE